MRVGRGRADVSGAVAARRGAASVVARHRDRGGAVASHAGAGADAAVGARDDDDDNDDNDDSRRDNRLPHQADAVASRDESLGCRCGRRADDRPTTVTTPTANF